MIDLRKRVDEIKHRIGEIDGMSNIYNLDDDSIIESIVTELNELKVELNIIKDEKLK
jgi:hypothetical protein